MNFNDFLILGWSLMIGILITSCGAEDSDDNAATMTAEIEVTTGTALNVGVLALDSIGADSLGLESSSGLLLADGEDNETASSRDAHCSDYGNPMDVNGSRLEPCDDGYAETAMYCAVAFNTYQIKSLRNY